MMLNCRPVHVLEIRISFLERKQKIKIFQKFFAEKFDRGLVNGGDQQITQRTLHIFKRSDPFALVLEEENELHDFRHDLVQESLDRGDGRQRSVRGRDVPVLVVVVVLDLALVGQRGEQLRNSNIYIMNGHITINTDLDLMLMNKTK